MKTKEEILKEFEEKYSKEFEIKSEPENYIHKGLDPSFNILDVKNFLAQALTQTREETIREVENMINKEFPHQKLYCEAQDLRCEILEELNKLKK